MNLGDTFLTLAVGEISDHLWFVVSHPTTTGRVALVNVSSDDGGYADARTLLATDHPWLRYESYIRTDRARLGVIAKIEESIKRKLVIPKEHAGSATVRKLQAALLAATNTRSEVKRALREQGFVPSPFS